MAWKLYDVAVAGYGSAIMTGRSASAVRADAWRSDVFSHISFREFMGMCRVKVRRDPLPDDGYAYVRERYGVDPKVGQRVRLSTECAAGRDREGTVLYPGRRTASVLVLVDGAKHGSLFHPSEVFPLPTPSPGA